MQRIRHNSSSRVRGVARKKEGPLPRRHSRLRQSLLTGAFLLALLPHSSAPTSASVRASGDIVATDRSFATPDGASAGYTSSLAAATLQDMGFRNATDVAGGFQAWKAAGLPVG